MKTVKKIFDIIIIFIIIMLLFTSNNVYAAKKTTDTKKKESESEKSFMEEVFDNGKKWKEMGEEGSDNIIENANSLFKARDDIYVTIRVIGAGIFVVAIAATGVSLSMSNNGRDIAGMKMTIAFTFLLAVLFLFAQPIMETINSLFELFEDTI